MRNNNSHLMDSGDQRNRCPLCGGFNHCEVAKEANCDKSACWCSAKIFPPALLQQLPEDEEGVRCICPACLQAFFDKQCSSSRP